MTSEHHLFRIVSSLATLSSTNDYASSLIVFHGSIVDMNLVPRLAQHSILSSKQNSEDQAQVVHQRMEGENFEGAATVPSPKKKRKILKLTQDSLSLQTIELQPTTDNQDDEASTPRRRKTNIVMNGGKRKRGDMMNECSGDHHKDNNSRQVQLLVEDANGHSVWVRYWAQEQQFMDQFVRKYSVEHVRVYGQWYPSNYNSGGELCIETCNAGVVYAHCIVPLKNHSYEISNHPLDRIHGFMLGDKYENQLDHEESISDNGPKVELLHSSPNKKVLDHSHITYKPQLILSDDDWLKKDSALVSSELQRDILDSIKRTGFEDGLHVDLLIRKLMPKFLRDDILLALNDLAERGLIYTGIDEKHLCSV